MAHIVLIDDEPTVRGSLVQLLDLLGHTVSEAASIEQGLEALQAQPADLVLTDIELPGGGLGGVANLRGQFPALPIIVMSGRSDWLGRAEALGAAGALEKPFTLAQLEAGIGRALAGASDR